MQQLNLNVDNVKCFGRIKIRIISNGVYLIILVCTPLGFTRLFTILGNYVVRPKVKLIVF